MHRGLMGTYVQSVLRAQVRLSELAGYGLDVSWRRNVRRARRLHARWGSGGEILLTVRIHDCAFRSVKVNERAMCDRQGTHIAA